MDPKSQYAKSLKVRADAFGEEDQLSWVYRNDSEEFWEKFVGG